MADIPAAVSVADMGQLDPFAMTAPEIDVILGYDNSMKWDKRALCPCLAGNGRRPSSTGRLWSRALSARWGKG